MIKSRDTILVVEDEMINRLILIALLKKEYEILIAEDGLKALELANANNRPDLILMDISMPGIDGYEVCRRLKSDGHTRHIPIIFITGMTSVEEEAKGLGLGAVDYITKPFNTEIVLARVKTQIELKNRVLDLRAAMAKVQRQKDYIEHIFNIVPQGLLTVDAEKRAVEWNASFTALVDNWATKLGWEAEALHARFLDRLRLELLRKREGEYILRVDGQNIHLEFLSSDVADHEGVSRVISLRDVTELAVMRRRLAQSEKLESVYRLAAGIAHEINTPTQYVVSNLEFLNESYNSIAAIMKKIALPDNGSGGQTPENLASELKTALLDADWEFLESEIPNALRQSHEGMKRIKTIVTAMKHFSRPSGDTPEPGDINTAIESTVTVAENEWKPVADMGLDLDPSLPPVPCFLDQFNQVILNMILNSVDAVEDARENGSGERGTITISTRRVKDFVEIAIADSGIGMTDRVKKKIFDPFFTTKDVDRGTGQGLAVANDIIVNKHGGEIEVSSAEGAGTTFFIRLPVEP